MKICKVIKEGTKKEYTYLTEIDLMEGDKVVAEFGKTDAVLIVTGVGEMTQEEYDSLGYPLKTAKGLASEIEPSNTPSIDIKIEEEKLPVISINFDELKENLQTNLEKYQGLIVTEQTLSGAKSQQKELAGLRTKINRYRIDKSKELSLPITVFDSQCKELVTLIESVEKPIKAGIEVFDNQKKDMLREQALSLICEVIKENGLNEKYGSQLTVLDKYCNLSAKVKDTKDDLTSRAMALKVEQDREAELLDIIADTIATENKRITKQLSLEDFNKFIIMGMATKDILSEIRKQADNIFLAENPPKIEPVIETSTEVKSISQEPIIIPVSDETPHKVEKSYWVTYKLTGKLSDLLEIKKFIESKGVEIEKEDEGEIE